MLKPMFYRVVFKDGVLPRADGTRTEVRYLTTSAEERVLVHSVDPRPIFLAYWNRNGGIGVLLGGGLKPEHVAEIWRGPIGKERRIWSAEPAHA